MILGSESAIPEQRVAITLTRDGLQLKKTFANRTGDFSFMGLTEGDYEVKIESPGYHPYQRRIALRYRSHEEEDFSARLTPVQTQASNAQNQEPGKVPLFRITSSLVVVDFVAIDNQGRFVTDLKPKEMQVFEDGEKQVFRSFIPPTRLPQPDFVSTLDQSSPSAAVGPNTSRSLDGSVLSGKKPAATVILIDSRIMDSNNFARTVAAIRRFVNTHLEANHSLMLAEINRGLRIITPMTRDRAVLVAAISQLKPQTVYNPLAGTSGSDRYFDVLEQQVVYVRDGLKTLCYSLAGQPGRKHVVYFSEGYPLDPYRDRELRMQSGRFDRNMEARMKSSASRFRRKNPGVLSMLRDVVSTANSFDISFYTIDARGLVAVPAGGSADRSGDVAAGSGATVDPLERARQAGPDGGSADSVETGRILAQFTLTEIGSLENSQNSLLALAAGTNGTAFFNTNDLTSVLRASTLEQENYYLAGYTPSTKRKTGKFHKISVKTTRPGVLIRARMGYLDMPDGAFRQLRLAAAFDHPELFQQISPLARVETSKGKMQVVIGVPAPQISFRRDGKSYHAEVVFLGQIYGEKKKPISKKLPITRGFNLRLTPQQFQGLGSQPLLAKSEVKLKKGRYRLVLLAEDRLSGAMGATVQEFTVP